MSLSIVAATGDKRAVSAISVRDEGNISRLISEIWVRDENNVPRQVWGGASGGGGGGGGGSYTAAANPSFVSGAGSRKVALTVYTNQTTIEVAGGVAPYTFQWVTEEGWDVQNLTSAVTSFSSSVAPNEIKTQAFSCTVKDAQGNTAIATVQADVSNYYNGGGVGDL